MLNLENFLVESLDKSLPIKIIDESPTRLVAEFFSGEYRYTVNIFGKDRANISFAAFVKGNPNRIMNVMGAGMDAKSIYATVISVIMKYLMDRPQVKSAEFSSFDSRTRKAYEFMTRKIMKDLSSRGRKNLKMVSDDFDEFLITWN